MALRILLIPLFFPLFALVALRPTGARAEVIAESASSTLSLRLERTGAERTLAVSLKAATSVSVFSVENPNRLVIDIEGLSLSRLPLVSAKEDAVVRGLRLGVHPGKARIVIDIAGDTPPQFHWETAQQELIVRFSVGQQPASSTAPSPTPTPIAPTVVSNQENAPAAVVAITPDMPPVKGPGDPPLVLLPPEPTPIKIGRLSQAASPEPTQMPPSESPLVTAIRFLRNSQQQAVLAVLLNQRREFRLARLDARTYRLTIPGVGFAGSHVALPFYPPSDFIGFTHCIPKQRDDGIEILIGVDRGARAEASVLESTIHIAVTPQTPVAATPHS